MLVHPRAGFFRLAGMTDRKAVLDDILTLCYVADGYLMSGRHILQHGDMLAVHFYYGTCRLRLYSYNHIVGRIDFQDRCH